MPLLAGNGQVSTHPPPPPPPATLPTGKPAPTPVACFVGPDGVKRCFRSGAVDPINPGHEKHVPALFLRNVRDNKCLEWVGERKALVQVDCEKANPKQLWVQEVSQAPGLARFRNVYAPQPNCIDSYDPRSAKPAIYGWPCMMPPRTDGNQRWTLTNKTNPDALQILQQTDPKTLRPLMLSPTGATLGPANNPALAGDVRSWWSFRPPALFKWAEPGVWKMKPPVPPAALRDGFLAYAKANYKAGLEAAVRPPPPLGAAFVRVATLNVHYWTEVTGKRENFANIISDIIRMDADVVCLQEVTLDASSFLKKAEKDILAPLAAAGYKYVHFCEAAYFYSSRFGNLTLSRLPFVEAGSVSLGKDSVVKEDRCFTRVVVKTTPTDELVIYNVHLDVHDDTEATRLKQVQQLMAAVAKERAPVVLCGDMNSVHSDDYGHGGHVDTPNVWQWIQHSDNARKISATPELAQTEIRKTMTFVFEVAGTFPPPATSWPARTVDYIYLDHKLPHSRVRTAMPFFTPHSDHIALWVDIWKS